MNFELSTTVNGRTYVFDGVRDEDEMPDKIHYYIGDSRKTYQACVHIEVDLRNNYAILQRIAFHTNCSLDNTVLLGKVALKYLAEKHRTLTCVSIQDDAEKAITIGKQICVTPRLLLQGKNGWYQKHFGALPTSETMSILRALHKQHELIQKFLPVTTQADWGDAKEIIQVAREIIPQYSSRFLTTSWYILLSIIQQYDVDFQVAQSGSGSRSKKIRNVKEWYYQTIHEHLATFPRFHVHTYR